MRFEDTICGIPKATVHKIVRRTAVHEQHLASLTGLDLAAACVVGDALVNAGYLEGSRETHWHPTELGQRLAASPLVKRFTMAEARKLVEVVTERAVAVNGDRSHSLYVTHIILFGSVLTGGERDLVGDVDIAVGERARWGTALWGVPERQHAARWREVQDTHPPSRPRGEFPEYDWPEMRLHRRLKAGGRKISVHRSFELEHHDWPARHVFVHERAQRRPAIHFPWSPARPSARVARALEDADAALTASRLKAAELK